MIYVTSSFGWFEMAFQCDQAICKRFKRETRRALRRGREFHRRLLDDLEKGSKRCFVEPPTVISVAISSLYVQLTTSRSLYEHDA